MKSRTLLQVVHFLKSRGNSVSIMTRLRDGWPGLYSWEGQSRNSFLYHHVQTGSGGLPSLLSNENCPWYSLG